MKKPILILLLIAFAIIAKAQQTPVKKDSLYHTKIPGNDDVIIDALTISHQKVDPNQIYFALEIQAQFPGGMAEFNAYIKKNQQLPLQTDPGRVIVQFVVELDGSLSNIKILRSRGDVYSTETMRLLSKSPKWIPGMQNGQHVRSYYTAPISLGYSN